MNTLSRSIHDYFYQKKTPLDLSLSRILFFTLIIYNFDFLIQDTWKSAPSYFWNPVSIYALLNISSPPLQLHTASILIFKVACVFSAIGLLTRTSVVIAAFSSLFVFSYRYSFSLERYGDAMIIITLFLLALSRCGDSISIDYFILKRNKFNFNDQILKGEYNWPIKSIRIIWTLIWFSAGYTKLRISGLNWFEQNPLMYSIKFSSQLLRQYPIFYERNLRWGQIILQYPTVCYYLGICGWILEFFAPAANFSKKLSLIIVPSLILMLVFIYLIIGYNFLLPYGLVALFWIPWEYLLKKLNALRPKSKSGLSHMPF